MALSGTLNTSGYYDSSSPYYIQFTWTATQSIANNTSTVSWSAKIQGGVSSGYYNNLFSRWISVNGSVQGYGVPYDGNYPQTQVTNGYTVYSGTTTVNHNADGTGSFAVSIKANIEFSYPALNYYNTSGSTTFTLDSIPRAAEITSAPNFNDQDNPVLSYSNPAGSAATVSAAISLDGTSASIAYRNVSQTSGSYTFNLTTAERNTLRNATTSAQSRTVYFLLKSVIGSNTYTRSVAKTFTVADVAANRPEFTSHSIAVDNSAIPSTYRSSFNGMYIQNVSKATISMAASAKYSATISGYSSTFNGKTYSGNSFTSDLITSAGSMTLSSTVTDSRGLKGTDSKTISASAYATPYMTSVQAYRCNSGGTASDTGTYIKIQATRSFTSLNAINHALIRYRYKESTSSTWESWVTILARDAAGTSVSTVVGAGGINKTKAYDLQLSIVDDIGKETVQQLKIPTEDITLHLKAGGKAIGFGTYAGSDETITSAWPITAPAFNGHATSATKDASGNVITDWYYHRPNWQSNATSDWCTMPLVRGARANRLAFLPPDQVIIEQTTNGGSSWSSAGVSDDDKKKLFSGNYDADIKIPLISGKQNTNCGIRITITGMKYNVPSGTAETSKYNYWNSSHVASTNRYCTLGLLWFWVGTAGGTMSIKVSAATGANPNSWTTLFQDSNFGLSGWNGSDWCRFNEAVFGGGTNQTGQYWNYRLEFFTRTLSAAAYQGQYHKVCRITGYGSNCWTSANYMMSIDSLYGYDYNGVGTFNGSASKLGTSTIGNGSTPIYLNGGTPVAATTVATISSPVSRSGGLGIQSHSFKFWGRVGTLSLVLNGDGAWHNKGDNIFTGSLASAMSSYKPAVDVMGTGYYSDMVYTIWVTSAGAITVRLTGYSSGATFSSGSPLVMSVTYVF